MKNRIIPFLILIMLVMLYPSSVSANTSNMPISFSNVSSYYNILNATNKFLPIKSTVTYGNNVDGVSNAMTATGTGNMPELQHLFASTPQNTFNYVTFKYKFSGENTTAEFSLTNTSSNSKTLSFIMMGDNNWHTAVLNFSEFNTAYSAGTVKWYKFAYTKTASTINTQFYFADFEIFKYNPYINGINFDINPVVGNYPPTLSEVHVPETENYTITDITWQDANGTELSGVLNAGYIYTAIITIKADDHYLFSSDIPLNPAGAESSEFISCSSDLFANSATYKFSFNLMGLNILRTTPENGASSVKPTAARVSAIFNTQVDETTLTKNNITVSPNADFEIETNGAKEVYIIFKSKLNLSTNYTVVFGNGILSTAGQKLEQYNLTFTTADQYDVPMLAESSPYNGETDVLTDKNIKLVFDSDMNSDTIVKDNIEISPHADFEIVKIDLKTFEIKFLNKLSKGTLYSVKLKSGISSVWGIPIAEKTISFSTVSNPVNLIINGDMEDVNNISVFNDANNYNSISFASENDNHILKFKSGWSAAPVLQSAVYKPGHTYFTTLKVKSNTDQQVWYSFFYDTIAGENNYHNVGHTKLEADKWTDLTVTFTIPANLKTNADMSIRFIAENGNTVVYLDDWQMFDLTQAQSESGTANFENLSTPDGAKEISPYDYKLDITFDKAMRLNTLTRDNITSSPNGIADIKTNTNDLYKCTIYFNKLAVNTDYTINFSSGVQTLQGNSLADSSIAFSTITVKNSPVNIVSTTPANGAVNTEIKGLKMKIVFDTYIDTDTISKQTITTNGDIIKEIQVDKNNLKEITLVFNDSRMSLGQEYTVNLSDNIKSLTGYSLNPAQIKFKTKTIDYVINKYNTAISNKNVEDMKSFMQYMYCDIGTPYDFIDELFELDNKLINDICETLINKSAVSDKEGLIAQISEAVIVTTANNCGKAEVIEKMIISEFFGLLDTGIYSTWNEILNTSQKNAICESIMAATYKLSTEVYNDNLRMVIISALEKANGWEKVKKVLQLNSEFIDNMDLLLKSIDSLKEPEKVYNKLQNFTGKTLSDVYSSLKSAYDTQKAVEESRSSDGSGGGGKSKGSGALPVVASEGKDATSNNNFTDLDSVSWAQNAILNLYKKGIVCGRQNSIFDPNDTVKREEFVKMLVLAMKLEGKGDALAFDDVKQDEWYYHYISSAISKGLVNGISEKKFGIGNDILRQDAAVLLYRLISPGLSISQAETTPFEDYIDIEPYAKQAVLWLKDNGIIQGDGAGRFNPNGFITRAEAAVIVDKFLNKFDKAAQGGEI